MKTRIEQMRQARRIHGGLMNMFGAAVGVKLSRMPIPRRYREKVFRTLYGKKYDALNEEELEKPFSEYRSINDLFTRGVRDGMRPLPEDVSRHFVCPCDSTVQEVGTLQQDTVLTAKDIPYQVSSLAPESATDCYHDGRYAILFLSPKDCHRIFSPQEGTLDAMTHVPGYRLLVHPPYQRKEFPTFTLNERLVMELTTPLGRCLVIMVAGWGVGHITHPFETGLRCRSRSATRVEFEPGRQVQPAEWIATFELGSTVIMITEPTHNLDINVAAGDPLRYGQPLFSKPS